MTDAFYCIMCCMLLDRFYIVCDFINFDEYNINLTVHQSPMKYLTNSTWKLFMKVQEHFFTSALVNKNNSSWTSYRLKPNVFNSWFISFVVFQSVVRCRKENNGEVILKRVDKLSNSLSWCQRWRETRAYIWQCWMAKKTGGAGRGLPARGNNSVVITEPFYYGASVHCRWNTCEHIPTNAVIKGR